MIQFAFVALGFLVVVVRWLLSRRANKRILAPGPPSDPLIGHLRSMPSEDLDVYLYEMGKKYGKTLNLRFPGQNLLVLNGIKPAVDLLDGRSANYSGRPRLPLAEVIGISDTVGFMDYNDEFRLHRKILQKHLAKDKIQTTHFRSSWQGHAAVMAHAISSQKGDWFNHFLFYSSAIIIELAFGHRTKDHSDQYVKLAYDTCFFAVPAVKPNGSVLVDVFPFLTKLPSWVPGNYFVENARKARTYFQEFRRHPYVDVQRKMAEGRAKPCILVSEIADLQNGASSLKPEQIEAISAILFIAGLESTASTLAIFAVAMLLFPEVQVKGQEEIQRVIGTGRLPDFNDRDSLPYVECIVHEILRWRPTAPLGVPHLSKEDDEYNGYFIPKKTIVMTNIRAMSLDETVYKDPTSFNPDRFKPKPEGWGEPPFAVAFGFGRRICPGRHLVSDSLWIGVATLLATVKIGRPKDSFGREYIPDIKWEVSASCRPATFPCEITPRNVACANLLSKSASLAEMSV